MTDEGLILVIMFAVGALGGCAGAASYLLIHRLAVKRKARRPIRSTITAADAQAVLRMIMPWAPDTLTLPDDIV